jgi:hypothetical protein
MRRNELKINNIILTKHNLTEMVKDWEAELSKAMSYQALVVTNKETSYSMQESTRLLIDLRSRMNNIISSYKEAK